MDALLVVGILALIIGLIGAAPGIEVLARWIQAFAPRLARVTNSLLGFLSGLTKITMSRKQITGLWLVVAIAGVVLAGSALTRGSSENGPPPTPHPPATIVVQTPTPGIVATAMAEEEAAAIAGAIAIITPVEGSVTEVPLDTLHLEYGYSGGWFFEEVPFVGGSRVPFTNIKSFDVVADGFEVTVTISLLNGKAKTGVVAGLAGSGATLIGQTDIGRFTLPLRDVKRVEFQW